MISDWVKQKLEKLKKHNNLFLKDKLSPEGDLKIIVFDEKKQIIDIKTGKNLVVLTGRNILAQLLGCRAYGTSPNYTDYIVQNNLAVSYLKIGKSDSGIDITNTDLVDAFEDWYSVDILFPTEGRSVEFIGEVGIGEPSSVSVFPVILKEAGLYCGTDVKFLFSRKIYPAISKTREMTVIYDWTIKF